MGVSYQDVLSVVAREDMSACRTSGIDSHILVWGAKRYDAATRLIGLAGEINASAPEHLFRRIADLLDSREIAMRGSRLLVVGLDMGQLGDPRGCTGIQIMEMFMRRGSQVVYHDPRIPTVDRRNANLAWTASSIALDPGLLREQDCTVLVGDCICDVGLLVQHSRLVIDARDPTRYTIEDDRIVRL